MMRVTVPRIGDAVDFIGLLLFLLLLPLLLLLLLLLLLPLLLLPLIAPRCVCVYPRV